MEINIVGRNLDITDRFRTYATEKAERIATFSDRAQALEIKVSRQNESRSANHTDRVELTWIGPGPLVRAESDGTDKYAAFDLAMAKLMERLRRARDRRKVHRGHHRPTSLREAAEEGFSGVDITPASPELLEQARTGEVQTVTEEHEPVEEDVYNPVVIRKKVFASTPMTVDDALYYMELVGHDFYLFIDSESGRPSVVYRRRGWDYGLIGLDDEAELVQEEATRKRNATS